MSSILDAAKTENRLDTLIALRDRLAERLDRCNSDRDLAAMSRQLVQVLAEIEEIRGSTETRTVSLDDFRNKIRAAK